MKKQKLFAAVILFFISSSLLAQNKAVYTFADHKHSLTIPFELSANHIYLKLKVNQSDTLFFLFDSGAATSGIMIDSTVAREIGLKPSGKVSVNLTGGKGDFLITDSVSLTINELYVSKQKAAWFLLKDQEKEEGHKIDGVLGYSFIKYFVFEIDYLNRRLKIFDPVYYDDKKLSDKILLIDLDKNRVPIMPGVIFSKKGKSIKTEFTFDTGHDEYLILGKQFLLKNKLGADTLKIQPSFVRTGLGGATIHKLGKINGFTLGPKNIKNPVTIFAFDPEGIYADLDGALLGGKFFKNYKLILNYPKKYLVLIDNKRLK